MSRRPGPEDTAVGGKSAGQGRALGGVSNDSPAPHEPSNHWCRRLRLRSNAKISRRFGPQDTALGGPCNPLSSDCQGCHVWASSEPRRNTAIEAIDRKLKTFPLALRSNFRRNSGRLRESASRVKTLDSSDGQSLPRPEISFWTPPLSRIRSKQRYPKRIAPGISPHRCSLRCSSIYSEKVVLGASS